MEIIKGHRDGSVRSDEAVDKQALSLGIDIGSISSDVIVLDERGHVIFKDYRRTHGRPIETIVEQIERLFEQYPAEGFERLGVTGLCGRLAAEAMGAMFINEVRAQALGVSHLYPEFSQATVIEMGGQDSKLIFLESRDDTLELKDFALNSVCAAGTGAFLDQQAERLGVSIEDEFGRLALQSTSVPQMAGRCSVFAKSDMIHLQQVATPVCDIVAGLCLALARSLKSNLGCGRQFVKPVIFTGGVAANAGVVRAFEEVLGLEQGELIVPGLHFYTGALGAALAAGQSSGVAAKTAVEKLRSLLTDGQGAHQRIPHRGPLAVPVLLPPESRVYTDWRETEPGCEAYLGVDVGSISTNVAVVDSEKRVLAKAYLMTAGRPLEAVREGLRRVGRQVAGKVRIAGAATTGSGRYLTGDFIGADVVINEITAQAAGAVAVCPEVDTIFEIGGQDSKFIRLENGVVLDFEMNHACAAGTGSFLEEQAQRLGISIKEEFAALAAKSPKPVQLGERCTVFIESDLLGYQQRGAKTEDLVAGLAYSIVANYLHRVVGRRKIGRHICFQGGTAFNKAVWAAFETVLGKPIRVPDHHEMTGAIGAALIAAEHVRKIRHGNGDSYRTRFRGFENLAQVQYTVETFMCEHCPNACEIKKVQIEGAEPLYYGSRCDRYNVRTEKAKTSGEDILNWRTRKLFEHAEVSMSASTDQTSAVATEVLSSSSLCHSELQNQTSKTVAIPRALITWQVLPLFSRFFKALGLQVSVSGKTTKKTIQRGVESVPAQPCFPVKAAFGHVCEILETQPDFLFIPFIPSMTPVAAEQSYHKLCPYVQSFAFQVQSAFAGRFGRTQLLSGPLRLGEGPKAMKRSFRHLAAQVGAGAKQADAALEAALKAQQAFENDLREKGRQMIESLGPQERLFVLISRPYNGLDEGMNLRLSQKLEAMGVRWMPMEMLDLASAPLSDTALHRSVYWSYGQRILRAAEIIRRDNRLFGIYLSNFSCGPDSFLQHFFTMLMQPKPALLLELDEHSADAGLVTRLEAFFESLKHYRPAEQLADETKSCGSTTCSLTPEHTLYIPYMGDVSYAFAACFKAYGRSAEVMPIADEDTLNRGRQYTTGKECLPCAITIGEMLRTMEANGRAVKSAFFMPGGSGPCRFGMYNCLQRLVLGQAGQPDATVISPNQDDNFYAEFARSLKGVSPAILLKEFWKAVVGADLLHKVLLRVRPYARDAAEAERLYRELLEQWCQQVEGRSSLARLAAFMEQAAERLAALPSNRLQLKPRIGVVGEIYVRLHPFANNALIRRLESLGAACELASFSEWVYYMNAMNITQARRDGQWRTVVWTWTQNTVQRHIEKRLARPLERRFGPLTEEPISDVLELARPYLDPAFEGEAVLSVGKIVQLYRHGFGGVVNVMPFSCMPSTVVSTQTQRLVAECDGMPILNLSFDGQEDAAMMTRLEAFVEQVRQRMPQDRGQKAEVIAQGTTVRG
ncbi:MAG: CoA activase [Planctomycetes bacterium]|nr:CoA activase [Planctomycetota bacterium]